MVTSLGHAKVLLAAAYFPSVQPSGPIFSMPNDVRDFLNEQEGQRDS